VDEPFTGPIELWCKWTSDPLTLPLSSTVSIAKWRSLRKFDTESSSLREIPLGKDELPIDKGTRLPERGCNVEFTKLMFRDRGLWWTLGFEAFGALSTVQRDLQAVAKTLAESRPPWPEHTELASYPTWLSKHARKSAKTLPNCCSSLKIDVAWGEMDAYGHVNNAVYSRYIESARIKYLSEIGWDKFEPPILPILGSLEVRFQKGIQFPDRITVGTRPLEIREDRVVIEHVIISEEEPEVARVVGRSLIIPFDSRTAKKTSVTVEVFDYVHGQLQSQAEPLPSGGLQ
jgi:acyl-CoA thioester hydrolase